MMFPGAQYVSYVGIAALWVVATWATTAVFCLIAWPVAQHLIKKTKVAQDRTMGKKPPKFSKRKNRLVWPWWSEAKHWIKIVFWILFLVFGYTYAGPAFYIAKML